MAKPIAELTVECSWHHSGPEWYVELHTGSGEVLVLAGPFSSEEEATGWAEKMYDWVPIAVLRGVR